jgi:excisionase family DNA binding protein
MTKNLINPSGVAETAVLDAGSDADHGLDDRMFSIEELAEHIGVSRKTIYNWRAQNPQKGPVGFVVEGSVVRFFASDVDRWVRAEYASTKSAPEVFPQS